MKGALLFALAIWAVAVTAGVMKSPSEGLTTRQNDCDKTCNAFGPGGCNSKAECRKSCSECLALGGEVSGGRFSLRGIDHFTDHFDF